MFVESGCISTNTEFTVPGYIYFERSSSCLSLDINFTSLALSSVKIYSFELGVKRTLAEIRVILTTQPLGN